MVSAAADFFKDGKSIVGMIFNGIIALLILIIGGYIAASRQDNTDLKKEIDSKASVEYVDQMIELHEDRELEIFKRVEEIIKMGNTNQEKVLESINRRLERIEDRYSK